MDLERKYNLETYTLQREKAVADYQGRHKPEVNRAGVSTYGTTVPELSIVLCTIWDCLTSYNSFQLGSDSCDQYLKTGISTIQIPDFAATHINACTWVLQLKEMSVKKIQKPRLRILKIQNLWAIDWRFPKWFQLHLWMLRNIRDIKHQSVVFPTQKGGKNTIAPIRNWLCNYAKPNVAIFNSIQFL